MTRRHRFDEAQSDAAAKGDKEFVTKNNPAVSQKPLPAMESPKTDRVYRDSYTSTNLTEAPSNFSTSTSQKKKPSNASRSAGQS